MATYRTIQSQFTSGIISPLSSGLVGTDYYNKGLEIAENCFYSSMGGVYKRPGTKLEAEWDYGSSVYDYPIIIPVIIDSGMYAIVIGLQWIKAFKVSYPYMYVSPPAKSTEITIEGVNKTNGTGGFNFGVGSELSYAINNGKIYVAGPGVKPYIIELVTPENDPTNPYFRFREIEFVTAQSGEEKEGSVKTTVVDFTSTSRNYPTIIGFYDGRMFLGATDNNPATIWFSRSYDASTGESRYNDFTTTYSVYSATQGWQYVDLADLAGSYVFDDADNTTLEWMYSMQGLLVGTTRGIYACTQKSITSSIDNPIAFTKESNYAATTRQVVGIGNYVIYFGLSGVVALAYSQQYNSYSGGVISEAISQHWRVGTTIRSMAATASVTPRLYITFDTGDTFCCTFDPQNSLIAWSRLAFHVCHPLAVATANNGSRLYLLFGKEESTTNPQPTKGQFSLETLDEVAPQRSWQYPHLDHWEYVEFDKDYYIADSAGMYRGMYSCIVKNNYSAYDDAKIFDPTIQTKPAAYDVTYPDHAYRSTVRRNSEGATTAELHQDWFIGQYYSFGICLPRAELPANGTSQGNRRAVNRVVLRLYNSIGGEVFLFPGFPTGLIRDPRLGDIDNDTTIPYGPTYLAPKNHVQLALYKIFGEEKYDDWQQLFTGDKSINFVTPTISDDRIAIVQHDPLPFTVCAVIAERAIKEN